MPLVDPDSFGDDDCARVYIAGRLTEARRVAAALTGGGLDYFVDAEKFRKYVLGVIPREYDGVAFYVAAGAADTARAALRAAGLRHGLVLLPHGLRDRRFQQCRHHQGNTGRIELCPMGE